MRYGSIDATTATQLFINTTRFSLPRDIGTSDIGTRVHREGKGHRPENPQRAPTQGKALSLSRISSGVVGGFSAARFIAEPLMEVTTSWVGTCCLQVQFLVCFSRDSKGRCGPRTPAKYEDPFSSPVTRWGRKFQDHPLWVDSPAGV